MEVHVVQAGMHGPPAVQRRALRQEIVACADRGAELVVLPELIAHGVADPLDQARILAEPPEGPFVTELCSVTAERSTTVVAGYYEQRAGGAVANVVAVVSRGVVLARYAKIHLYDAFGSVESDVVDAGTTPVVVDVDGWRVGLLTCFDLRFPELTVLLGQRGAELLCVPAAWMPGPGKVAQLRVLAQARALDVAGYLVLADQAGPRCCGSSAVIAPDGTVLCEAPQDGEATLVATLDEELVRQRRLTLPIEDLRRCAVAPPGARSGTRTRTSSRTEVFETSASADSAIRAAD